MKKQNLINVLASAALVVALAFGVQSCKKDDPCDGIDCQNGGSCSDGSCSCPTGYEGSLCETKASAKFVGTYKLNESCPSGSIVDYPTSIGASSTAPNKILITGFGNLSCGAGDLIVTATVNGNDITVDANQPFCSGVLTVNSGSGTLSASGNSLTISYSYTVSGAGQETCSGTYTKQ